ncbi:MAG: hypothetical protein RI957_983 [Verrucomicrobiota bacterium]|jgi:uncharacterized lipoprotein YddW (UPF0748 family)
MVSQRDISTIDKKCNGWSALFALLLIVPLLAQPLLPARESLPAIESEFRGTWAAVIHNIDWPSSSRLTAEQQQAEMIAILDRMQSLHLNALIFQVRPQCDAVYSSATEPWSPWLTGVMGKTPGYDPLAFTIREARLRGIEVHAWFNPFRALANASAVASSDHITRSATPLTKHYHTMIWCDPALGESRQRALAAIRDVLQRYDVDGIHLDDYFYPYPHEGKRFADGLSNERRRAIVDAFIRDLYQQVKAVKPWARVGISPFGIWQPGVPAGTTASLNAYEDLACDAKKWLQNGWCDYLAPQLYWRIKGPQSYTLLLEWWRQQGDRPVWPGIATSRIGSSEDPGRDAGEIIAQLQLSRETNKNHTGHLHWSVKALMQNRDNIVGHLKKTYTAPALVPPMNWINRAAPQAPGVTAIRKNHSIVVRWQAADVSTNKIAIQGRRGPTWQTLRICAVESGGIVLPQMDAIALTAVNRYGQRSTPVILR